MRKFLFLILTFSLLGNPVLFAQEAASAAPAEQPAGAAAAKEEVDRTSLEKDLAQAAENTEKEGEGFVASRETLQEKSAPVKTPKVLFNPRNRRDPTLSKDDFLFLQHLEQQRLAAIEAERQRQLAEERRRKEEEERQRQLELARIKDPTREVRNKIRIDGIIGQEVFISNKIYTVGDKVLGAKIVSINTDSVVFTYKGHKFVRKMKV